MRRVLISCIAVCSCTCTTELTRAGEREPLRIGMSAAFSGPAEALGNGMRVGIESYFGSVNRAGGVHGRKLMLIALDDAYEPDRTAPNMRRLIDKEKVFCILGNVGTPTAAVAVPIANEKRTPLFGCFTGAGLLRRSPPDRYVINYRASYAEEAAEMVRGLTTELGIAANEIGFFTQNDAYGDAGWNGAIKALLRQGYREARDLPHGRYSRNTIDVEDALSRMLDPRRNVKAVIMVGAYKPCAAFIRLSRKLNFNPVFVNVSFVGSDALIRELGPDGEGVVITQVVPMPQGKSEAAIEFETMVPPEHQNFVSFEGFLAAKALVAGLKQAGANPTKDGFIDALERSNAIDLGLGTQHRLSPVEHQFSHKVWPTVIRGGRFQSLKSWSDLRAADGEDHE